MLRRTLLLAALVALALGCGKKAGTGDGGDPNATYTLKVREEQQGDKLDVTTATSGTTEVGDGGKQSFKIQEDAAAEYTENIVEMPAGAAKPTKLTRAYTKATQFDLNSKQAKPLSYTGKTVTIEKKGAGYQFTADGKPLNGFDAGPLQSEFGRADKKDGKMQDMLPKAAVKVNEPWTVDMAAVKSIMSGMPFLIDAAKSKATGKLTKAYQQDGKPWGTLEFEFDLALDTAAKGPKGDASGTIKINLTLDAVIDGSAPDGTMKMTLKADVSGKENGKTMKMTADMTRTKTIKSVK